MTIILVGLLLILIAWIFATIGFFTMKSQQQQLYNPPQYGSTPPSKQPEQGKVIESKGINQNGSVQSETLGRRGA